MILPLFLTAHKNRSRKRQKAKGKSQVNKLPVCILLHILFVMAIKMLANMKCEMHDLQSFIQSSAREKYIIRNSRKNKCVKITSKGIEEKVAQVSGLSETILCDRACVYIRVGHYYWGLNFIKAEKDVRRHYMYVVK